VILELTLLVKLLFCGIERLRPRRPFRHGVLTRWSGNGLLMAGNAVLVRGLFVPGAAIGTALYCEANGIGLFQAAKAPPLAAGIVGWLALDLVMWGQHWLQHRLGLLWRSHRVHHSDLDLDVTTSLRFHPFEACYTVLARILCVGALGVPAAAVAIYEVALVVSSSMVHSSLPVPERLDAALRWIFTTPDVHRVHHSTLSEMESNYGAVLTTWDRLFRTYRAQPEKGHLDMELGLPERRDAGSLHLLTLLSLPFHSPRRG